MVIKSWRKRVVCFVTQLPQSVIKGYIEIRKIENRINDRIVVICRILTWIDMKILVSHGLSTRVKYIVRNFRFVVLYGRRRIGWCEYYQIVNIHLMYKKSLLTTHNPIWWILMKPVDPVLDSSLETLRVEGNWGNHPPTSDMRCHPIQIKWWEKIEHARSPNTPYTTSRIAVWFKQPTWGRGWPR